MNGLFGALNRLVENNVASDAHVSSHCDSLSKAISSSGAPWASHAVSQLQLYRRGSL